MDVTRPLRIVIASQNPVKAEAITGAFQRHFPEVRFAIETVSVASGVANQPTSDEETRTGAENRVRAARAAVGNADLWAGLEGGIEDLGIGRMSAFAWIIVESTHVCGSARTATFPLPEAVAQHIRAGRELGEADDLVFSRENSKYQEGAIGILTGGLVDRRQLYEHAALMAMIPLRNQKLFAPGCSR